MRTTQDRRQHLLLLAAAGAGLAIPASPAAAQEVPFSSGREPPRLKAPSGATDCHHHVYDARFPPSPTATLKPPDASVEDYRKLQRRLGLSRNVVVQPSTYGTDNRLLVEALEAFGRD